VEGVDGENQLGKKSAKPGVWIPKGNEPRVKLGGTVLAAAD
jgi:hypothetical protein